MLIDLLLRMLSGLEWLVVSERDGMGDPYPPVPK